MISSIIRGHSCKHWVKVSIFFFFFFFSSCIGGNVAHVLESTTAPVYSLVALGLFWARIEPLNANWALLYHLCPRPTVAFPNGYLESTTKHPSFHTGTQKHDTGPIHSSSLRNAQVSRQRWSLTGAGPSNFRHEVVWETKWDSRFILYYC